MPKNISPMFGTFDLCAVEENKKKNFFRNQPKRTLPRPVISERRKIFENGWISPLWNSESVKSVFQTVDFSPANVLTGRGWNFLKEFSKHRWFLPAEILNTMKAIFATQKIFLSDHSPKQQKMSVAKWRDLIFSKKMSVELWKHYQVFRRFCPLSSRGVLQKSPFRG